MKRNLPKLPTQAPHQPPTFTTQNPSILSFFTLNLPWTKQPNIRRGSLCYLFHFLAPCATAHVLISVVLPSLFHQPIHPPALPSTTSLHATLQKQALSHLESKSPLRIHSPRKGKQFVRIVLQWLPKAVAISRSLASSIVENPLRHTTRPFPLLLPSPGEDLQYHPQVHQAIQMALPIRQTMGVTRMSTRAAPRSLHANSPYLP